MRLSARRTWSALTLLAALGPASADERVVDIFEATHLAPALSPDGTHVVIDLLGQLWRVPTGGGGAAPLTPAGEHARQPGFSPDGRQVVYQRWLDGQWDLWLLDATSGERRALTTTLYNERDADFRTDGAAVVFAADITGHYCLWSLELATGVLTQLTEEPGDAAFPAIGVRGEVAYVLERDGSATLRLLTADGFGTELVGGGEPGAPSWRPGGGVLVFPSGDRRRGRRLEMLILSDPPVRKVLSEAEDVFDARAVWPSPREVLYAADGGLWRRELSTEGRARVPVFAAVSVTIAEPAPTPTAAGVFRRAHYSVNGVTTSGDGQRRAFTALGDLWLDGRGGPRRLTDDAYVELEPTFTPDGRSIVFSSDRAGTLDLWEIGIDDGRLRPLTFGAGKSHGAAVSPDGRRVAFLETDGLGPSQPARLRVLDAADPSSVRTVLGSVVSASSPAWRDARTVAIRVAPEDTTAPTPGHVTLQVDVDTATARDVELDTTATTPTDAAAVLDTYAAELELTAPVAPPREAFVLQIGRLFDGTSSDYLRHVDIHVADGRIVAIVGRGERPPAGEVIELIEATAIPGLVDVHAHQSALAGERLGRAWLAFGVTTVREIADDTAEALERAEAWETRRSPGPRLVITPRELPAVVPPGAPVAPLPAIGNGFAHAFEAARRAAGSGVPTAARTIELGSPAAPLALEVSPGGAIYQDGVSRLIAADIVVAPGLAALAGAAAWPDGPPSPRTEQAYRALFDARERSAWAASRPNAEAMAGLRDSVVRIVRNGGRVAVASDAPAVPYGLGVHLELSLLAAAGLPGDQVLRMATVEGALALGLHGEIGTLETGKRADIVILDGNPLDRITDTLEIRAVVKDGVWYEREALLTGP